MQEKKQLFKLYTNFLSKKKKNEFSYDFYVKGVYGFLKFKCFWNFSNFTGYFKSFNAKVKKKESLTDIFYANYKEFS